MTKRKQYDPDFTLLHDQFHKLIVPRLYWDLDYQFDTKISRITGNVVNSIKEWIKYA